MPTQSADEAGFPDLAAQFQSAPRTSVVKSARQRGGIPFTGVLLVGSMVVTLGALLNFVHADNGFTAEELQAMQERLDDAKGVRDSAVEFMKQIDLEMQNLQRKLEEQRAALEKHKSKAAEIDEQASQEGADKPLLTARSDGQREAASVCIDRMQDTAEAVGRLQFLRNHADAIRARAEATVDEAAKKLSDADAESSNVETKTP